MTKKLFRVYNSFDVDEVKKHLLIHGALSSSCANCQAININLDSAKCPECDTEIKYITFQNPKEHFPKLIKQREQRPSINIIDYDDYKRNIGEKKAEDFLK